MPDYDRLNREFLPKIETRLAEIRNMPADEKHDALTDMLANVSSSPDERIKLRGRLLKEFGYSPEDFNATFACRFSMILWEKVGRPN